MTAPDNTQGVWRYRFARKLTHWSRRYSGTWSATVTIVSIGVGLIALIQSTSLDERPLRLDRSVSDFNEQATRSILDANARLEQLSKQVALLASREPRSSDRIYVATDLRIRLLSGDVKRLRAQVDELDRVILANPSKAIETITIRRDLDSFKAKQTADDSTHAREVDRIYDLFKWVFGTFAVAIISLAVTNLMRRPKAD